MEDLEKLMQAEFKCFTQRKGGEQHTRETGGICGPRYKIDEEYVTKRYVAVAGGLTLELTVEEHTGGFKIVCGNIKPDRTCTGDYKIVEEIRLEENGKPIEYYGLGATTDLENRQQNLLYALRNKIQEVLDKEGLTMDLDKLKAMPRPKNACCKD
jgi:hypothetical protein